MGQALRARRAEREAKLVLPRRTPDNSSAPPSQGAKASSASASKPNGKAHPDAHPPLHQNPTTKRNIFAASCQHCGADVSQMPQIACEAYDRVEIPKIEPAAAGVKPVGGSCPCCAKKFKAPAPQDMPKGSPPE